MHIRIGILPLCALLLLSPSLALAAKMHKVKKKETISSLARKYHVTVSDLKAANNLVNSHIDPGDVLVIPPRAASSDDRRRSARSDSSYRVRKGESLARVAKKTGVSVTELRSLNGLNGNRVKPGQVLVLREEQSPEEPKHRLASAPKHVAKVDLFSEDEYDRTLAELTDADPGKPVELSKNIELKVKKEEATKALRNTAYTFLGTRYRFGANSRTALDCSSFVQQVFRELKIDLPRTAREQYSVGNVVAPGELQKGDLVFFHTYARYPSHVGIYLGDNKMIHASSRDRKVVISTMNTPYYLSRFIGAKRIGRINPDIFNFSDLLAGAEEESEDDILTNDTLGIATGN